MPKTKQVPKTNQQSNSSRNDLGDRHFYFLEKAMTATGRAAWQQQL